MQGLITYNGFTSVVEIIDGRKCLKFCDLSKLTKRNQAYFYTVLAKKRATFVGDIIKKAGRKLYITLEGCVRFLNAIYQPEDGLIREIKGELYNQEENIPPIISTFKDGRILNMEYKENPDAEKIADIELKRLETEKVKANLRAEDESAKIDDILKRVKAIELSVDNLQYMMDKRKCDESEKGSVKGFLKDLIVQVVREALNG